MRTGLAIGLVLFLGASGPDRAPERIVANENRVAAGTLTKGVLTVRLDARYGTWFPDGDSAPGIAVQAFGEIGKRLQVPGPLIRVPAGTELRITIGNSVPGTTLRVFGLAARDGGAGAPPEPLTVAAGSSREVRFRLDIPGTYTYWGTTSTPIFRERTHDDSQLSGAIVVDDPTKPTKRDRIFVITELADSLFPGGAPVPGYLFVTAINGRSWPHTERLQEQVGDSVRWRIVNISHAAHPMHLHGFYFTVESRGNERVDTIYAEGSKYKSVTERIPSGGTVTMTWVPEREGNWLFHCHVPIHIAPHLPLDRSGLAHAAGGQTVSHGAHSGNHSLEGMAGLVMGIEVRSAKAAVRQAPSPRRAMRLLARVDSGGTAAEPAFGFTLDDGISAPRRAALIPGPVLSLERGKPVDITVVNQLAEPTAVHWHGIELESYFDGVAGFGGMPGRISPVIAAQDSFVARFTPPRSGTFMYHTHVDELRQEPAGLSGIMVVHEPNEPFDSVTDHPILISSSRRAVEKLTHAYLNGSRDPAPLEWRAGVRHRIRLANIMLAPPSGLTATLFRDSTITTWRPIAKDGADLPPAFAKPGPSRSIITIGETKDFEWTPEPGDYRLELRFVLDPNKMVGRQVIRVR
jgi:manganese oxidase